MKIVIIGATSAIAKEVARRYCEKRPSFVLAGRSLEKLEPLKADLETRGARDVNLEALDFSDYASHAAFARECARTSEIDILLIAHGSLPDQETVQDDFSKLVPHLNVNFASHLSFLSVFAQIFAKQGRGCIAVFTSVAGDRGRKSNYVYGSFKAGMQAYLEGLRARMSEVGVGVLDIRPGFVDTPMTADVPKNFLFVSPAKVAGDIEKAIEKRKAVLYTPFFWHFIMLVIKAIPRPIFNRMSL